MSGIDVVSDYLALGRWLLTRLTPLVPGDWRVASLSDVQRLVDEPPLPGIYVEYEGDALDPASAGAPAIAQHVTQTWRLWLVVPTTREPDGPGAAGAAVVGPLLSLVIGALQTRARRPGEVPEPAGAVLPGPRLVRLASGRAVGLSNGCAAYPLRYSWRVDFGL